MSKNESALQAVLRRIRQRHERLTRLTRTSDHVGQERSHERDTELFDLSILKDPTIAGITAPGAAGQPAEG